MKRTSGLSIFVALACVAPAARAQSIDTLDLAAVGRDPRWRIVGRTTSMVDIKGKHALKLSEAAGMGVVWIDGYDLANGVVELDLLGRSQPVQGSFLGLAFHVADSVTYDAVYFRPFNFRATDSTRHSHAVQYVSHPAWPWQKLRSERPGLYEKAVVPEPDGDAWFHVRIVIERPAIRVFVNDAAQPSLVVDQLSERRHGSLGLWVGQGSGGCFANLRVQKRAS
jgi:hypothetical protein